MFYQENALKSNIFLHIPNIQEKVIKEEFDIDYMANALTTMNSTGAHPGGLLLKPEDIPFEYVIPQVYVADNPKGAEISSSIDYHSIEDNLIKIDALGHGDPETLKELEDMTGVPFRSLKFNDPKLYQAILDPTLIGITDLVQYPFEACTMGISEMNTEFTMKMLRDIKPQSFTDLIYFSGLSHGTSVWQGNVQRDKIISGELKLHEAMPVRDIIFQHLAYKYNFDPKVAFDISEFVRKGKGIAKWEKELRERIPAWMVNSMKQIKYMFPKAHAASYILMALRIFQYKIHYPSAFYAAILNRYGVGKNNNKNVDFYEIYNNVNSIEDHNRMSRQVEHQSDNEAKIKDNKRIISIIWEMKLRGIKLKKASFSSKSNKFSIDHLDTTTLLMPLLSVKGVGDSSSEAIAEAYEIYGDKLYGMSLDELKEIKVPSSNKKVFGKKVLEAFELE